MLILALDLATVTGVALGVPGDRPTSYTMRLKKPDQEPEVAPMKLGALLRDVLEENDDIENIYFERPLDAATVVRMAQNADVRRRSSSQTADFMQRLAGAVYAVAWCYGMRPVEVAPATWRKSFLGVARPKDKQSSVRQCRLLRWGSDKLDDNEADALGIWFHACGVLNPRVNPILPGPLFERGDQ